MSGAQGYIQINGPESPREGGRGAIRPPGLPPHRPYSRPRSREEFESLHHPVPSKSLTPSHWSLDYEEDLPVSPRRERNGRYYPRAASPRRIEPGPQYNDVRGSRPTLTAREDLSTYHVVQIDMCMFDDAGYPLERAWERVKCFIVHVTEEEALRKIAKLERETEPVLDKIQNNLTSLMREQLEYGRKFLESEEDPCSAYDLVQFETKIQKVNHSLRGSREELYEDWGRGDKKRSKSKDRKKHKTKISSKNHRKHKSTKDRERSSSSRSKYIEAPVAITAYFKRTPFQEEPRPRLFREREDEAWEDNEMQQYRRSPVEYHQQDRQYSRGGRDAQHYSNYPAMHSPSNSSSHSALAQERYAGRDHREPYDEGYRGQSGMNQHERPVGNHHQQQQQYNMPQQQPQQQPHVAQQQQQHNMHQQSQPAMAQQRPQQQQDQHNVGHQGGNHQNLQGFPPANQQRQAPVAPQGQGGMMQQPQQQQQQQHQPVVNQQKQQVQPQMAHQQQHQPQQQQQVQPQMMHQQHQQQQHHPQPQQQAQPQMAQQHQQQPPAVVQQKQQVQPQMAQQQQQQQQHKPQQQPQPQQQHAQPGMAQRQQPAPNQQQPQPAMVHQHGQQNPGQQQQKGQAMPPQAAAQMKGQAAQKAMGGKDKGPQPPPPHVPPALRIQTPASIEKAGRSQHEKKMSKGSPKRHRAHPESPDFSESSGSEVCSESEDDVSTPATSTSGGSHHKSKKSPTRYKEEHFGNPARHHVKPGTRFIDEQGYEREGPPPSRFIHEIPSTSPRKVYAEDLGYSPKISSASPRKIYTEDLGYLPKKSSSSPRASYGEDEEYFRKATRSPQRTYRNERGNSREASPSPRPRREDFNRSPTAHLSSRRDDPARRILQNVRRMSPELGQEILDEERSWTRNRANRSPLEEDRTRGRTGRPHERDGDYDFVEKRRRPSAKDFPEVKNYHYDGHYGRGAQESRHRSDDSEKYTKYRDYSRSPERPRGARRATYETR